MQNNIMNVKCLHHNTTHNDARLVPCPKTHENLFSICIHYFVPNCILTVVDPARVF
jgi:hypothetical protein